MPRGAGGSSGDSLLRGTEGYHTPHRKNVSGDPGSPKTPEEEGGESRLTRRAVRVRPKLVCGVS